MVAPLLVFAIGNESRGDDGLAPALLQGLLDDALSGHIELVEDFQLQVEHVTDLVGRRAVLFVDADMSCAAPFNFSQVSAAQDNTYTSHAMTPYALLYSFKQVYRHDAPPSFLLKIRGYDFELGKSLSEQAAANLVQARKKARDWLETQAFNTWPPHWRESSA